jgi:GNAT superfamily N-acetyltransferase
MAAADSKTALARRAQHASLIAPYDAADRFKRGPQMSVEIIERDVTKSELERMKAGFVEHDLEFGIQPHTQIRYGVVAMDGDKFIGRASGLMDRNWFFLSDLWLEKEYRGHGTGSKLLQKLEAKVFELGIARIYTWTAGFEAPLFL